MSINRWMDKDVVCIHRMENYSAIKKNKITQYFFYSHFCYHLSGWVNLVTNKQTNKKSDKKLLERVNDMISTNYLKLYLFWKSFGYKFADYHSNFIIYLNTYHLSISCTNWFTTFPYKDGPLWTDLLKQVVNLNPPSVQSSSVTQLCLTLWDPMDCSTPGLPVHHQLPELTQSHVHWVVDANQPSHPLLPSSPHAFNLSYHQGLFFASGQFFASSG